MNRPTRGGADSVKFRAGSGSGQQVHAVDPDDPNTKPDAWFVYILPTQTGVEMIPTLRYGYWESERPKIVAESDLIIVGDIDGEDANGKEQPVLIITPINQVVCHVAQAKHLTATPLPQAKPQQEPS